MYEITEEQENTQWKLLKLWCYWGWGNWEKRGDV